VTSVTVKVRVVLSVEIFSVAIISELLEEPHPEKKKDEISAMQIICLSFIVNAPLLLFLY
jgi:hypothetical protein